MGTPTATFSPTLSPSPNDPQSLPSRSPIAVAGFWCDPVNGKDGNIGTKRFPFKTLARAQKEVQRAPKTVGRDVNVFLSGGIYTLEAPLEFEAADSGGGGGGYVHWQKPPSSVLAAALYGDIEYLESSESRVQVSGGVRLTDWQISGGISRYNQSQSSSKADIWSTSVAHLKGRAQFRHLIVNGRRADRTSLSAAELHEAFAKAKGSAKGFLVSSDLPLQWNRRTNGRGVEFRYPQQGAPWTGDTTE